MQTLSGPLAKIWSDPLQDPGNGHILTRAIINTIQEPLIILDEQLGVIAASKSFYKKFSTRPADTQNKKFYNLGNGQWNIPAFKTILGKIIPENKVLEEYRVEHTFSEPLGHRIMLVNAQEVRYRNGRRKMLLAIFDVTEQERLKAEREKLIAQKDLLLREMRHRIANSLQLIASILLLKAASVKSEETRFQLEDAHNRIVSIAKIQEQLDPLAVIDGGGTIAVGKYLTGLCASLAKSMIGGRKPITIGVRAGAGTTTSDNAIIFGLMTTELVINCLKHAFPNGRKGKVVVTYKAKGPKCWMLSITDNGVGRSANKKITGNQPGLGTGIIAALAAQAKATIKTASSKLGTTVSITHAGVRS